MSNEVTFDLDQQPGIRRTPISRTQFTKLAEALDLDPRRVISIATGDDEVRVVALLKSTDGAQVLGSADGFLKHEYTIPVVPDEELETPSEHETRKHDEDMATYKRVREYLIARYGSEDAYLRSHEA